MSATNLDSLLKALEILAIMGASIVFVFKLGRVTTRFELIGTMQGREISELKNEVKALSGILVNQALQTQRLDMQAERLVILEKRLEELRHGEGFVRPFKSELIP